MKYAITPIRTEADYEAALKLVEHYSASDEVAIRSA